MKIWHILLLAFAAFIGSALMLAWGVRGFQREFNACRDAGGSVLFCGVGLK
jgi:hypothetical protein